MGGPSRWRLQILLAIAFTVPLAGGCGSGATPPASSPGLTDAASPSPIVTCDPLPAQLVGTYTSEVTRDELPPEEEGLQTGLWVMRIGPGNKVILDPPIRHNLIDYTPTCVSGDEITFAEEPPGGACSGFGPGTYRWLLAEKQLTLTTIQARCPSEAYMRTVHPWSKVSDDPSADTP
jgi:hypothetical protein